MGRMTYGTKIDAGSEVDLALATTRATPDRFRAFLASAPPGTTYRTRDAASCPIASFGTEMLHSQGLLAPDEHLVFNPDAIMELAVKSGESVPSLWEIVFGKLVDAEPTDTITPARCLELLDAALLLIA